MTTAPWTWANLEEEPDLIVTDEHLALIRALKVGFETVENGAASVEIPEAVEVIPTDFERVVDLFLNHATLERFGGRMINPYSPDDDELFLLEDVPDPEIRALFESGEDIEFEASESELALFAEANLGSEGIDPKRPFGSQSVSRDVRRIIDPEKKLNRKDFSKARKYHESRMLVLLQFFVQNAKLSTGTYTKKDYEWRIAGDDEPKAEQIDVDEWYGRVHRDFHTQNDYYARTIIHLQHLVWDGRIVAPYATLVGELRLHDLYEDYVAPTWDGTTLEHALAGYKAFGARIFAGIAIRVLNARAEYGEALKLLKEIGRFEISEEEADLRSLTYPNIAMLEVGIARYGSGEFNEEDFQSWLEGSHSSNRGRSPYPLVHDVVYAEDLSKVNVEDYTLWYHMKSACAQVHVMRGPYKPE